MIQQVHGPDLSSVIPVGQKFAALRAQLVLVHGYYILVADDGEDYWRQLGEVFRKNQRRLHHGPGCKLHLAHHLLV